MPEVLKALIVDDEPLARRELAMLLDGHRQVRVVGQAGSIEEASRMVRQHDPEVVFLDVRLARGTGFDLLESLPGETSVVFVTAHADHAVEAFAVDAADYLLKPVRPRRLAETIARLEREHAEPPADGATRLTPDDRLLVRASGRTVIVPVRAITCFVAEADRSRLWTTAGESWPTSRSLREWEHRLPAGRFGRIHRSALVNLEHVTRVEDWSNYTSLVYLARRTEPLTMSRRYGARLRARLR